MSVDENLLGILIDFNEKNPTDYVLHLNSRSYPMTGTSIENSAVPVNEPTTRGGVYFSEKFAYKMKGVIDDLSVIPLLTKSMLGPNTEFGELRITTTIESEGNPIPLEIFTNLTNSVQTPNSIELNMIVMKLNSV